MHSIHVTFSIRHILPIKNRGQYMVKLPDIWHLSVSIRSKSTCQFLHREVTRREQIAASAPAVITVRETSIRIHIIQLLMIVFFLTVHTSFFITYCDSGIQHFLSTVIKYHH